MWCKGAVNSPVGGRSPSLGGSKCRFLLALLSSLIDKHRVSATPVYTLATRTDGAWRHWNLACYLLTVSSVHILYAITAAAACCRQNREHFSILTYCMIECLRPRPYNGKATLHCEHRITHGKKQDGKKKRKSGVMSCGRVLMFGSLVLAAVFSFNSSFFVFPRPPLATQTVRDRF